MHIDRIRSLRGALMASTAVFSLGIATASAQTQQQTADEEEEVGLEEIIVTGSRIKRAGFDTLQPASVIDSEFVDTRGFDNVARALEELPGFFPGLNNDGGQASQNVGQSFVNAFGLGTQRTLVLINGRRTVGQNTPTLVGTGAAAGLQVDLNIIPTALLDRTETIYTGGAPIYGSDAIAGTVNILLKDDFEGLSMEGQWGKTFKGGAERYLLRSALGANFADGRGNVAVAMEFSKQQGLRGDQRPEYSNGWRANCRNLDNTGPDDGIPDEVLCQDAVNVWAIPTTGFIIPNTSRFTFAVAPTLPFGLKDEDGDSVMFGLDGELIKVSQANLGDNSRGNPGIFFSEGADGANNPFVLNIRGETTSFRSPLERYNTYGLGHYDISDHTHLFFELLWSRSESADVVSQPPWGTDFFAPDQPASKINIADNPFVSERLRNLLIAQGAFDPTLTDDPSTPFVDESDQFFTITRANIDFVGGGRNFRDQNVLRYVAGAKGDFDFADRNWTWELAYTFGQTHATTQQLTLNFERLAMGVDSVLVDQNVIDSGNLQTGNFVIRNGKAVKLSASNPAQVGDIACRVTAERPPNLLTDGGTSVPLANPSIDNCVPVNIMGFNQFAPEARDFVTQTQIQTSMLQQTVIEANIVGEVLDLPAGPVGFAGGYTHRRERGAFRGGQGSELGIPPNSPILPSGGGFNTHEVYSELVVPVLADGMGVPFVGAVIDDLRLEGAYRIVDNNRAGTDITWVAGGRLEPNIPYLKDSLQLRGNFTRAIRSPSIPELFQPLAKIFTFAADPCDNRNIDQGPNPAVRRANCEAQVAQLQSQGLLPSSFDLAAHQSLIQNRSAPGLTGGNTQLANEKSNAWSVGFVFQPREFLTGFSLAADWSEITIKDAMITPSATQVANACYDNPNFPNVQLAGGFNPCTAFSRLNSTNAAADDLLFEFVDPVTVVLNAAERKFAGLTVNADYNFAFEDLAVPLLNKIPGTGVFQVRYFYLNDDRQTVGGSDEDIFQGENGNEPHTIQVNLIYHLDRFNALVQFRRLSDYIPSNEFSDERRDITKIPAWNVVNLTLGYQVTDHIRAQFIVNNVFDDNGDSPIEQAYDLRDPFGRRFLFSIAANF